MQFFIDIIILNVLLLNLTVFVDEVLSTIEPSLLIIADLPSYLKWSGLDLTHKSKSAICPRESVILREEFIVHCPFIRMEMH